MFFFSSLDKLSTMHTHHSHSGEYVKHAKDTLEQVVQDAIDKEFDVFCLTEHMPRYRSLDLYPEELAENMTPMDLMTTFERYYTHASEIKERVNKQRLENKDSNKRIPQILLGFECEGFDEKYLEHVENLQKSHHFDMFVGSVHHVHSIPIDYDKDQWDKAAKISFENKHSGKPFDQALADRELFNDYFDLQFSVLTKLTPPVIGHFDLIRLFGDAKYLDDGFIEKEWPDVWERIQRNLDYAISYGALFELNSAAIRKGWDTPYPRPDVAKYIIKNNGMLCLSDDSHGIAQVGLNYHKSFKYLEDLDAKNIYYLSLPENTDPDMPDFLKRPKVKSISLTEARNDIFWKRYQDF